MLQTQVVVQPNELSELLARVDRIVVHASREANAKILYQTEDPGDLAQLASALQLSPHEQDFCCMCSGTEVVRLYRGQEELAWVANHHGESVRCSLFTTSDALLADGDAWVRWFDDRGMPGPRKQREASAQLASQAEESFKRWLGAMPSAIRPLWEAGGEPNIDAQRALLLDALPDPRERVLALFSWFGSGQGPWSGFPSYEMSAETLLLDHSTAELVDAAAGEGLTPAQLEGAARLFASWTFGQQRKQDRGKLPLTLKTRLLAHSVSSALQDTQTRARRAFGKQRT